MKIETVLLILFHLVVCQQMSARAQSSNTDNRESLQIELWADKLRESGSMTDSNKLESLQLGLKNMAHRKKIEGHSPEIDVLFSGIQTTLLAIPGHAQYFADEIERERELIKDTPPRSSKRSTYNSKRFDYLNNVLTLLPSPETIKVLGHYLDDERDPLPPSALAQDWSGADSNAKIASGALIAIGLRNAPVVERSWDDPIGKTAIARQRVWFSKVAAGEIAFSFIGQSVEYRFKPDGTWDTIAMVDPPRDNLKAGADAGQPRDSKKAMVVGAPAQNGSRVSVSGVWAALGLILVAVLAFLIKRGTARQ